MSAAGGAGVGTIVRTPLGSRLRAPSSLRVRTPSPLRAAWLPAALAWLVAASVAPQPLQQWLADICGETGTPMFASAPASSDAHGAARPATKVTVLSCTPLPQLPGKTVTTAVVDFPPGAYSPAHRHPGSVTVFITEGTVRSQLQGEPPIDYTHGQTFFEAPGTLHVFAENPDPVRHAQLVAFFVTDEHCGPLTIPEPAAKS
jgi:quercetin dioxygenase-like cupin family protein